MDKFQMPEMFINVIKNQALTSEDEIYGWLIGFVKDDVPNILAIIECKQFIHQSLISAVPQTQEFQEISSIMPQGIGPVGIYHSHPFKSQIFHSHTDDSTLISLSNQFPNCVSLVTNGEDINYYQMGKKSITKDIDIDNTEPILPKFLIFCMEESISINIDKEIIDRKENIKIKIVNLLRNYLERVWKDIKLTFKGKQISKTEKISKYLVSNFGDQPINLYLSSNAEKIYIDLKNNANNLNDSLVLNINLRVPIYISNEQENFETLGEIIKTELISNNILPKVFQCTIDFENREILIPREFYLNFFGFLIKILCFDKAQNQSDISRKVFELTYKLASMFESYSNIKLSNRTIKQINEFFKGIKELSKKFIWKKEMATIIKSYEKRLKL